MTHDMSSVFHCIDRATASNKRLFLKLWFYKSYLRKPVDMYKSPFFISVNSTLEK